MKKIPEYLTYFLIDILGGDDTYSVQAMFGGYGIYKYGIIFAIYVDNLLYFKVGDQNKKDYEEKGSKRFSYTKKGKITFLNYYELPEEVLEERKELDIRIEKSLAITKGKGFQKKR